MKNIIIGILIIILLAIGGFFGWRLGWFGGSEGETNTPDTVVDDQKEGEGSEGTMMEDDSETVIGTSVEGRDITAYHYGDGDKEVVFVGGIHGGYEWNTVLVARELMDYLETTPSAVPEGVRVTVIPLLNPDGLHATVGTVEAFTKSDVPSDDTKVVAGRFNANNVDLNRNFDCDWQETGMWQKTKVDAGTKVFSEPESQAIRDYITGANPEAVVVYYSSANGVFASSCHNGVLPETLALTNAYADASGYPAFEEFNFYEITGDMVNWLASENIPAISVLLATHTDAEWSKNKAGVEAVLEYYAN